MHAGPLFNGRAFVARILALIILAAVVWSLVIAWGGAITLSLGPVRFSSRTPARSVTIAVVAVLLHALLFPGRSVRRGLERLSTVQPTVVRFAPGLLVLLTLWQGVHWGTWVAGGSDPYGYVSEADLWAGGQSRIDQPWAAPFDWPMAEWCFAPLGYRPGPVPLSIVPTYSAGVPMLMAIAKLTIGSKGPFLVVPLLGALAVYLTYRLGRTLAGALAGVLAAGLLATSPAFLHNLMLPVSDVSAAAAWTLAVCLALHKGRASPWLAGFAASAAILIRPNVAPLLALPGLMMLVKTRPAGVSRAARWTDLGKLAAGALPGVGAVMLINLQLYGSPLKAGYGSLADQFELGRGVVNLGRYAWWFWDTQPAVGLLALLALFVRGTFNRDANSGDDPPVRPRVLLTAMIIAPLICYLFYLAFDEWTYLRFLLPAFPALTILGAAGLLRVTALVWREWQFGAIVVVMIGIVTAQLSLALERGVWDLRLRESRYVSVARDVERRTPGNAMVICMQHSGSLRYYGHRRTLRWDWLPPEWLDRAVVKLQQQGYRPYILLEDWEIPLFRGRFATSAAGHLSGTPLARLATDCTLFDPLAPEAAGVPRN